MRNRVHGVDRTEVARRLEVVAAGLRSGVVDYDDVHAPIPDRVQMALTITEDAIEISLAWGVDAKSRLNPPTAEELLNMDSEPLAVEVAKSGEEGREDGHGG